MALMTKITGIIRIFRPELPFAAGVCVVVGEILALGGFPALYQWLSGFLCAFFLSASALILNDYFDIEVDRVNAPERPLPSGMLSGGEAVALSLFAALIGLLAAWVISLPALLLGLVFWLIGFLYNWKYKQAGLAGNLMVSSSVAITFILGGMAAGSPWNKIVWVFSLMAFLIDLGEEIAGDAMDIAGDVKRGSQSIAIRLGKKTALNISAALFFLVLPVSLLPALFVRPGVSYLVMILITDVLILFFTVRLLRSQTPAAGRRCMRGIYLGALLGLLAFILVQFFQ